jgi:nickel-dependent lactate racemase
MKLQIPYGTGSVPLNTDIPCTVLEPNKVPPRDEMTVLREALSSPYGGSSFEEFIQCAPRLLVIVNDATRPTPTARVLDLIGPALEKHPDVRFLIATGVHRAPTEEEFGFIFGAHYQHWKGRVFSHDARKDAEMVDLGVSSNGTEMAVNRMLTDIGNMILIGGVEPHYFAGYSGGRKSILPGVAAFKTIEMNHKLAMSDKACALALDGNPVNEDMVDAMKVLKDLNIFSIQTVLTGDHKIYAATSGGLHQSFDAAVRYAQEVFCVPLEKKVDLVVTVAPYPMDIDLYQAQKALDNSKLALADGGIVILVSKCRMGVGEDAFLELLSGASTPEAVLKRLEKEYKLGFHKAAKMAQIGTRAEMWAVTGLPDEVIRSAMMRPFSSVQDAVDQAVATLRARGREPEMVVMPAGSLTLPNCAACC